MDWNNINRDRDTSGLGPVEYDQTKVPALIRKHADNVRTKTYGQEVREAQARNAEYAGLIASEAKNKATNADILSKDTQHRFKDQIEGTTNSDEVIDARRPFNSETSFGTLGERLDDSDNDVSSRGINVKKLGAVGDGETMDTETLQSVVNTFNNIYIPDGDYLIDTDIGLDIPNGITITFTKNARLVGTPTEAGSYQLVKIIGKSNVKLVSPTIIGDGESHLGATGEWGHGLVITSSTDVDIYDANVSGCWGDGIYLGANDLVNNERIRFHGTTEINDCGRQGMSVISAIDSSINRLVVDGIQRTAPAAGLDIEPNNNGEWVTNFKVGTLDVKNSKIGFASNILNDKINCTVETIITENTRIPVDIKRGRTKGYSTNQGILKIGKVHILNTLDTNPIKVSNLIYGDNNNAVVIDEVIIDEFNSLITGSKNAVIEYLVDTEHLNQVNFGQLQVGRIIVKRNNTGVALHSLYFNNLNSYDVRPRDIEIGFFKVLYGTEGKALLYTPNVNFDNVIGLKNGRHNTLQTVIDFRQKAVDLLPNSKETFTWVSGRTANVGIPERSSGICQMYRVGISNVIATFYAIDGTIFTRTYNITNDTYGTLKEISQI